MACGFDEAEMYPCDICGEGWPREEMYDLPDGSVVCPDCMNRFQAEMMEMEGHE